MIIVQLCAALIFFCMAGCITYVLYVAIRPWSLEETSKYGDLPTDVVREIEAAKHRSGGYPRQ